MKKFGKIAAVLAALALVLVAFTSCDPTVGLNQLSASDVSANWIKGTWSGYSAYVEWSESGKMGKETVTRDLHLDYSTDLSAGIAAIAYAAIATSGNLYANKDFTKFVYYEKTYWDDEHTKLKTQYTYSYTKNR